MNCHFSETFMKGYWWECESCGKSYEFSQACSYNAIAHYIRDTLISSSWDQSHLLIRCNKCGKQALRITYEFPRAQKEILRVVHIVGLGSATDDFIPMMWESYPLSNIDDRWFDFKYIRGRSPFGLTRPVVLSISELRQIFKLYCIKAGTEQFP